MPIYVYSCKCGTNEWENYKQAKDRHLETCIECGRVAKLNITVPAIQVFHDYHYRNINEHEVVRFGTKEQRDRYLKTRGMRQVEPGETKELKDESKKLQYTERPKYDVNVKDVNGIPTRIATPKT